MSSTNDESLTVLSNLVNLVELNIGFTSITGQTLHLLPTSLSSLILIFTDISDKSLSGLGTNITRLSLNNCRALTSEGIPFLPKKLRTLEAFETPMHVEESPYSSPISLRTLYLTSAKGLIPPFVTSLIVDALGESHLSLLPATLENLVINSFFNTSYDSIKKIPRKLTHLHFGKSKLQWNGTSVRNLPSTLKSFCLEDCKLTNGGLQLLPTSLRSFFLARCSSFKKEALGYLQLLPELREVAVQCVGISQEDLNSLPPHVVRWRSPTKRCFCKDLGFIPHGK